MPQAKDLTGDLGKLRGRNLAPDHARPLAGQERRLPLDGLNAFFWFVLLGCFAGQWVLLGWLAFG